ncbi:IS1634 family transposase ISSeq4 [Sporomusa acidovorans DSM 3132]|uniref:IS1634 family transposase ISSeq4 n=1 Tax=Sporomusa acidovorans (strain ATCC 49682 / DSM 3132 / Mol) TaxID=1123286 RepID=A0ABZ3J208_SPOA4
MFLKQSISNGKIYLSFVQGYRADGKVKQKTIEKLGYLDDLKKSYDDPIAHFKSIAKERNLADTSERSIEVSLNRRLESNTSTRKNLGYAIAKRIYSLLGINKFLQNKQKHLTIEYNLNSIFSLLTFNRFLFPSSKKKAFDNRDFFFESYDFSLDDLYRSLDYFSRYSEPLQQHLHEKVCEVIGRDSKLGYYDVTNYYFEIPYNDEDEYDDHSMLVKKGFRKKGPSKEHRPDPIVQMGLLMDSNGIPMAFNTFSGGESEKTSLIPIIRRVKKDYGIERIITVADRGLNTSDNTAFLAGTNDDHSQGHDGYVYGQSILSADKEFKAWVLKQDGYLHDKEIDKNGEVVVFTHKSRVYAKTIQLENSQGKRRLKMNIYQKQMVYYSQKYAEKQKKERELVLAKAKDLIANPGKYTRATSFGAAGYINNIKFVKETGEIPDGIDLSLNLKKIAEEEKYDGYYSIVTSEKHLSDIEIRNIYKGLWEIEESFKVIKSEFKARPVYLKLENHINAHFLICFVSLLILRVLEYKLNKKYPVSQIRESLIRYSCSHLDQNYYLFDYRDEILQLMESIFDMDLGNKIMSTSEIKKILQYQK